MSAGNKGPVWVASTVALLGALAGILQYGVPYFQWLMNHPDPQVAELQTSFNAGIADLENSITSKASDTLELRVKAAEAYRRAAAGPPNRTYSASDPDIAQATPLDAYTDYDNSTLTKCADKVFDRRSARATATRLRKPRIDHLQLHLNRLWKMDCALSRRATRAKSHV